MLVIGFLYAMKIGCENHGVHEGAQTLVGCLFHGENSSGSSYRTPLFAIQIIA